MPTCQPTVHHHLAPLQLTAALAIAFVAAGAHAADFTINGASTTAQSLAKSQTGSIGAGGSLTVGGGSNAVTVTGNDATLTNLGTITTTGAGSGRVVRDNTGVTGLVVTNGSASNATALMQSADNDVIQMNKAGGSVTLTNYGSMISSNASAGGAQVVDFNAITGGTNIVDNRAGGLIQAYEADAVRTGVNGVVLNAGTIRSITATGSSSDGIDFQNNGGGRVSNAATGTIEGGRHGITGGALDATVSFQATIQNAAGGTIRGDNGAGINIDGYNRLEVVTVTNAGTIVGHGVTGDGDGIDVDGIVTVVNTGTIRSANAFSALANGPAFSEGLSVGGGTIVNSGTIEGLVAAGNANAYGIGITLTGNDITSGPNAGNREGIYADAVVDNRAGGTIRGQNSSAIVAKGLASGYIVTITNAAGATIAGGGSSAAAIQTGLDADTVTNRGTIDGSSSGKAIDLGGGRNALNVVGGAAVILGDIEGGSDGANAMTLDIGAGNRFAYAGSIADFATVTVLSGTTTLTGASHYTGTTVLAGGVLQLEGAGRLAAASSLDLEGGTLRLVGAGAAGQSFASLVFGASSTIDLGGSTLTFGSLGSIAGGATLTFSGVGASGVAFRLLGDYGADAAFRLLLGETTIDGMGAAYRFDGTYTSIGAVPEPDTAVLLLVGLGVVAVARRRSCAPRV